MTDNAHARADEEPTTGELKEPSTEKEPGQEPTAPAEQDAEPDHEAVGIGIVGGEQVDPRAGEPSAGQSESPDRTDGDQSA